MWTYDPEMRSREQRRLDVTQAAASARLEGVELDDTLDELAEHYVDGAIDADALVAAVQARHGVHDGGTPPVA